MLNSSDLSKYDNSWYNPGGNSFKRILWYYTNIVFFINPLNPFSSLKIFLLRLFGSKVGEGVRINPSVNIKYPWLLEIGNYTWIGEKVWIDNLHLVKIGDNCCISQGAMLLTGNHNFKKSSFELIVKNITLEDGAWVGAQSTVCPGVICKSHSILTVGSIATKDLDEYGIYQGNPASKIRKRIIN
ncbi:WcaF family extracellular polysaccharide biosynthesis acetyltransferase [Cyclobacterium sp. 1_MG-2023]|uniref:WcaF family extracellular polysaccharide biosynthesis acetyltransferase n=1 Tax=Cyclobacterium sp. 1_MG-2023 TaxID=3062681 RepID=UPI0026E37538|nr:WcaF family extracellular polysaccharide biosynthesis acetyltransferase [Cyclobacterium sp. 1_MG-2023]MDO6440379.1 WcaF family extracellular polysaccharide biosynthesis acetyltransferase [Cyclobacterium sp. 1_MG-2023]